MPITRNLNTERNRDAAAMTLGIYVQVPFCQTKCTYCNFHTGVVARSLYRPYVDAVCREIAESRALRDVTVDTVYLGGGTPSLLEPADLGRVMDAIRHNYSCALEEVTLEADPETITAEKAAAWLDAGINRVSMGVQSLNDVELRAAGRMHRREDVYRAVELVCAAGFRNISMDLIAGLPHQTRATWESSVGELIALRPEHVSIYLLEVDDGSRLGKEIIAGGAKYGASAVPPDDAMAEFYESACATLAADGFEHYEISNWALPGLASKHNLKYWRRQPYIGFGAGAHSFDGQRRWANVHDPSAYAAAIMQGRTAIENEETVTPAQALDEELFLGLRQLAGIDLARIERKYGADFAPRVRKLLDDGLIERNGDTIRLNPAKLTISNEAFMELLG
ncbi:MAG TPA: radical SAM family heme chaperone HemW [Candidatus Dormibacteraeota bacterium]|nr:radical SAM family heme chaperone HemW [Candidatus Dormibacteraeota bacterium]